jgi:hypothetical protein
MKEILERIDALPLELGSIAIQAKKYVKNNSNIDEKVLNVLHRPWVAPLNWGLMLYSGAKHEWFSEFTKRTEKEIPDFYKNFLKSVNGGFIYGMSMYGLTPSSYETGTLNRTILQCHDLTTANNSWIREYDVEPKLFHFAGRSYTRSENVGYFFDDEKVLCYRKNGELIDTWTTFGEMLFDEIEIVEQMMLEKVPEDVELIVE